MDLHLINPFKSHGGLETLESNCYKLQIDLVSF